MIFKSVADLDEAVRQALPRIPSDVDAVVGIPRSGMLAAAIVALHLNVPLGDIEGFLGGRLMRSGRSGRPINNGAGVGTPKHVLVVDDSVWSGHEMRSIRREIEQAGIVDRITYAAVFVDPCHKDAVDISFELCPTPRVFEWNVFHHNVLSSSCVDIDGVLCRDPTEAENDDGPAYMRFVKNVEQLARPTARIGWLVTCRLEAYREATVQWLSAHGIEYDHLVMMNLPNKAERVRQGNHAQFKAEAYVSTGASLFIESDPRQAESIARMSSMPVLCSSTLQMVYPPPLCLISSAVRRLPSSIVWHAKFATSRLGRRLMLYVTRRK